MKKIISALLIISTVSLFQFQAIAGIDYSSFKLNDNILSVYQTQNSDTLSEAVEITKILSANTPVIIKNNNTINTENFSENKILNFSVVNDVKDNDGNTLISANTPVIADISFEKNGILGKSAKILIKDFYTTATDGTKIYLTDNISISPKNKTILSLALGIGIFPAFFLMKGENAILQANTAKTVFTSFDTNIKIIGNNMQKYSHIN